MGSCCGGAGGAKANETKSTAVATNSKFAKPSVTEEKSRSVKPSDVRKAAVRSTRLSSAARSSQSGKAPSSKIKPKSKASSIVASKMPRSSRSQSSKHQNSRLSAAMSNVNSSVRAVAKSTAGENHRPLVSTSSVAAYSSSSSSPASKEMALKLNSVAALFPADRIQEMARLSARLIRSDIEFNESIPNRFYDGTSAEQESALRDSTLYRNQRLVHTATGFIVEKNVAKKMLTRDTMEKLAKDKNTPPDTKMVFGVLFSRLDQLVPGVFLTGVSGLERDAIKKANITLVINATNEIPLLQMKNIKTFRVPVADMIEENISIYFDDVVDLIEANRRRGKGSVVHCLAGVSRSTTLCLAYLIKYTNLNLHEAFVHVKAIRLCVRPNMAFMQQLIDFELKVRGSNSTKMVQVMHPRREDIIVTVPDFYPVQYPALFESECHRQQPFPK